MRPFKISVAVVGLMLCSILAQELNDYDNQAAWTGTCGTGKEQSPININTRSLIKCPNRTFRLKFESKPILLQGSGQNFVVQNPSQSYIGINDLLGQGLPQVRLYRANSYHFHSPSEHTINGVRYDLEVHHFHVPLEDAEGKDQTFTKNFVNFDTSSYSKAPLFASVAGYLFYASDDTNAIDLQLRVDDSGNIQLNNLELLGYTAYQHFYNYRGSATTPGCTEGVDWFIYAKPLALKRSSFQKIRTSINDGKPNNRNTQPLNSRTVNIVGAACLAK